MGTETESKVKHLSEELEVILKQKSEPTDKFWNLASKLLVPTVIGITGWAILIDKTVAGNSYGIESNKKDIRTNAVNIEKQPPEWLKKVIEKVHEQNTEMLQRLSSLEAKIESK